MTNYETRAGQPVEIREENNTLRVSGYAAVFNEDANIGGIFIERILPGAFRDVIRDDDVTFLINHEGLPLARTRSGTLKLNEDDRGLHMATDLATEDPDVQKIIPKMQRGDLDKMSFGFQVGIEEWDESGELPVRTIKTFKSLRDVAIVTWPAYDGTDIGLRCVQEYRNRIPRYSAAIQARLRMKLALLQSTR